MENVFSKEAMELAVENLLTKNDSCGVDGICISEYREYYDLNGEQIREQILKGQYKPDAVQSVEILKKKGKKRTISKYTCTDRVIQEVLKNYFTPMWASEFSKYSYAYREEKGTRRPPLNDGNVFLYQRIATEIRKTALDIRIGFMHSTSNRSETLNLDIAEIFKLEMKSKRLFV